MYGHIHLPPSIAKVVGIPIYDNPDIYTVVFKDGSISGYTNDTLSEVSECRNSSAQSLSPSWIKGGANATLFLNNMSKPRHGNLDLSDENKWYFYPRKSKTNGKFLPDLSANCQDLLDTGQ